MEPYITAAERERFGSFLTWLKATGRKPKTILAYQVAHRNLSRDLEASKHTLIDLSNVSGACIRFWRDNSLNKLKPTTINTRLIIFQAYAKWAAKNGSITFDHLDSICAVKEVTAPKLGAVALTAEEFRKFISTVELRGTLRDKLLIGLLANGLRLGEVVNLKVIDLQVNAHRGVVEIRGEHTKYSNSRTVPLNKQCRYYALEYLKNVASGILFPGEQGILTESAAYKLVKKFGAIAGIDIHPHQLRHTFSKMYLATNNNDLCGLAAILGHSRIDITARHYARKSISDLSIAVDAINM